MRTSRWYLVASPEYVYVDVILDDGTGPAETIRDVLHVRASSAVRAKILAVRSWRRRYRHRYVSRPSYLSDNPFVGMSVAPSPAPGATI